MRRQWPREGVILSLRLFLPVTRGQTFIGLFLDPVGPVEGREGDLVETVLRV